MTLSNEDVARAWAEGREAKSRNMYTDGRVIYSYGNHFPIAVHLHNGDVAFNTDSYSNSTSKHQYCVRHECYKNIIECTTDEIRRVADHDDSPQVLVVTHLKPAYTVEEGIKVLMQAWHKEGHTHFPLKKLQGWLQPYLVASKLDEDATEAPS